MTYENQRQGDNHGAAASGAQREKTLRSTFTGWGFNFIRTQADAAKYLGISLTPAGKVRKKDIPTVNAWLDNKITFYPSEEYTECGFNYFTADGYCPELDAVIELKGGDKSGTTEEKVFFDLEKLRDGCYGARTVLYITEGTKENDKCTKLFTRKLLKSQESGDIAENVHVLPLSQLNREVLMEVAK